MATNNSQSGGIGFLGLLCIVFIVLKLTNVIAWPWWLVLSPFWAPFAIGLLVFVFIILYNAIFHKFKL